MIRTDAKPGWEPKHPFKRMLELPLPETTKAMETWMAQVRAGLLDLLTFWYHRSYKEGVRIAVEKAREKEKSAWDEWEVQTDLQTGDIYSEDQRDQMMDAMHTQHEKVQKLCAANLKFDGFSQAQELWEDFFYYQNPWNRRVKSPEDKRYRVEAEGGDGIRDMNPAELLKEMEKGDNEIQLWRLLLMSLYDLHQIGVREHVKGKVGVDDVHRYPEPVSQAHVSTGRKDVLETKYPPNPVSLEFDEDAIAARRKQVDEDPDAMEIDSERTTYYSTATASSWRDENGNPIPTSWESSEDWGPVIGPVHRWCTKAEPHAKPYFKVVEKATHVRTFSWMNLNFGLGDITPVGEKSTRDGGFRGRYVSQTRYEKHFVLDEKDQRILETNAPINLTHAFSTPGEQHPVVYRLSAERSTIQGPGRREKEEWRRENGLEDGEIYSSSPHGHDGDEAAGIGFDNDSDSDDGDLFARSYRACVCACHHDEGCTRDECEGPRKRGDNLKEGGKEDDGTGGSDGGDKGDGNVSGKEGDGGGNGKDDDSVGDDDDEYDGDDNNQTAAEDESEYSGKDGSSSDGDGAGNGSRNRTAKGKKSPDKAKHTMTRRGRATSTRNTGKTSSSKVPRPLPNRSRALLAADKRGSKTGLPVGKARAKASSGSLEDDDMTNEGTPIQKPLSGFDDETFTAHPSDPSLNIAEYNPGWKRFPNFIQRNEVPAPKVGAKKDAKPTYTVLPKATNVPQYNPEGRRLINAVWNRDKSADPNVYPSGRYTSTVQSGRKGETTTLEWIPQPLLRLFRRDTGQYTTRYPSWTGLESMLSNDPLDADDIRQFNKSLSQLYHRHDSDRKPMIRTGPWTNPELERIQSITDRLVRTHGLAHLSTNQSTYLAGIVAAYNGARTPADPSYRSPESIRALLNRNGFWTGISRAFEEAREKYGDDISDADLKPRGRSFFAFKRKNEGPTKDCTTLPRGTSGRKRKRMGKGGEESGSGESEEAESDVEEDSGSDGYKSPAGKRARRGQ
jgi:hypothetical protein